ncbi:MAG: PD40 domain-containing protein [Nitrospirae bacterium]|nr:PD40 domain-containing protein [Candidatus Manganitrophaceae bacterium]
MKRNIFAITAAILILLLISGCIPLPLTPPKFDPALEWKTIESAHFSIHFHQGEEEIAAEAAREAEEAYRSLTKRLRWTPRGRTQVVLIDNADTVNGQATPFPYNTIYIHPYPPAAGILTPIRYQNWIRAILFHEYTHIVQLDQATGLPGAARYLFGRSIVPNVWQPLWLIEGLATFEEGEAGTTDRESGPFSEMILRTAVLSGRFKSIDQAHSPDSWPGGMTPYYYGAAFHQFLKTRYGDEKIASLSLAYSARLFPFFVESNADDVLGERFGTLWKEWNTALEKRYFNEAKRLREEGLTPVRNRTESGFWNLAPVPSPDGKRLAYTEINSREHPHIEIVGQEKQDEHDEKDEKGAFSVRRNSDVGLSWTPDSRAIVFSQMELVSNFSAYSDLYRFELETQTLQRLTTGLRAKDPDVSPDGRRIVFVRQQVDRNDLLIWEAGETTLLLAGEKNQFFATPRWSPDGRQIALSVWKNGNQDVALFDPAERRLALLMEDPALDLTPVWSPDGRFLLFVSDREGIFDLFAYGVEEGRFYRVTRLLGGAFSPFVSHDGKTIFFSSYDANGFDIATIPWEPARWKLISIAPPATPTSPSLPNEEADRPAAQEAVGPIHPYFEPATLLPRFWIPFFGADEKGATVGLLTGAFDPLGKDKYLLDLLYGTESERLSYQFDYWNDHFAPTLHLQWLDQAIPHPKLLLRPDGDEETYWERERRIRVETIFPFLAFDWQMALAVGYQREELTALTNPSPTLRLPEEGILSGLRLSWLYNSAHEYSFSISPEEGRRLFLIEEIDQKGLGGDFNRRKTTAGWREYRSLPWPNQVLAAQISGGIAQGALLVQRSFQLGGLTAPFVEFEDAPFLLRGYPNREFRGERALSLSIEYRFPLINLERGWDTLPFFFRRLHATLLSDFGNVWDRGEKVLPLKSAVGASFGTDLLLGYYLPLRLEAGVARGLSEEGITQVFFTLGNAF